eukprot:scaffold153681_cov61-Attheya_sp.AAC.3
MCQRSKPNPLGVMKAANSQQTSEYEHLIRKTEHFSKALVACPLNHINAHLAQYDTVYMIPSVTYSFPTTSLSELQCKTIQKIVKPHLRRKMRFPASFPNDMAYGDAYFGAGVGLHEIYAEQGIHKTLLLM